MICRKERHGLGGGEGLESFCVWFGGWKVMRTVTVCVPVPVFLVCGLVEN